MNPKRELSSIDLAALVTQLGRYEGAKVDKAYPHGEHLPRPKTRALSRRRAQCMVDVGQL